MLTLWSLFEASLLCLNAVCVLHEERFMQKMGWGANSANQGFGDQSSVKSQLLNLVRSIRTVTRSLPKIAVTFPPKDQTTIIGIPSGSDMSTKILENSDTVSKLENIDLDSEMGRELEKKPLYAEITEPEFYKINSNLISKPVIAKNLPEHFNSLPIYGRPKHKSELPDFYRNKLRDYIGYDLNDSEFEKLSKYCSPDHLKTGGELQMFTSFPTNGPFLSYDKMNEKRVIDEAAENATGLKLWVQKKYKMRVKNDKGNYYSKKLKYRGIRLMPMSAVDEDNANPMVTIGKPLEPGKDILFRVRMYRPYSYTNKVERCRLRSAVFNCDVVLLGRQRLSVLRDRFVCANDVGMRTDASHCPDQPSEANSKAVFPSGFLFINNAFYVDGRAGCRDTSAGVRAWAQRRGLGRFPSRSLDDVRLEELVLRLGHPEVYVHQGNCEHLFTFSEVRVLGPRDLLRPSQYPAHTAAGNAHSLYCTTCAEFGAKWLVEDCPQVPFNPAFFCDTCFKLYLYNRGAKIGDFRAYHYRANELNTLKPQG